MLKESIFLDILPVLVSWPSNRIWNGGMRNAPLSITCFRIGKWENWFLIEHCWGHVSSLCSQNVLRQGNQLVKNNLIRGKRLNVKRSEIQSSSEAQYQSNLIGSLARRWTCQPRATWTEAWLLEYGHLDSVGQNWLYGVSSQVDQVAAKSHRDKWTKKKK